MNIFGFRPFKGKFNLGDSDDIPENQDGTLIGSVKQINNDLSVFSFRDNEGQAQYSMDNGVTWVDFKHPAGTLSITANGTYNVADYASANVNISANKSQTLTGTLRINIEETKTFTFSNLSVITTVILSYSLNGQYTHVSTPIAYDKGASTSQSMSISGNVVSWYHNYYPNGDTWNYSITAYGF